MSTDKIYSDSETGCCPRFDPAPWDKKEIVMENRLFMKEHVTSFMHIPINFGGVMKRSMEKITSAGALSPVPLMLSDENSLWGSDVYIAITKEVPGANNVRLSGTFLSKVFEGQFKEMGKFLKEMNEYVKSENKTMKKMYFYYTTCPACAKHYGKNYVVLLAQI
jgi:hypothetical protein